MPVVKGKHTYTDLPTVGGVNVVIASDSIDVIGDVDTTTVAPVINDLLEFDGSNWVPVAPSGGGAVSQLAKFTANDAIFQGAAPAGAKGRNSHAILTFDDTTDENVVFEDVMSADYSSGNLTVKIYWVADTATTGTVEWRAFFERMDAGVLDIDADSFATAQTGSDTTAGTAGIITVTSIVLTQAQADGITPEDAYRLKIERNTAVGGNMTGDAQVLRVTVTQ